MKKIIPCNKKITFNTNIASINSISLEHDESIEEESIVGNLLLNGEYKIYPDTTELEKFEYKIPFSIDFTKNIDLNTINIDIEDFTYEIENNNLNINISLVFEGEEVKQKEENREETIFIEEKESNIENITQTDEIIETNNEEYITYNIHIVKDTDTLEGIIEQYETSLEKIKDINDLSNIKKGDKIIIPSI